MARITNVTSAKEMVERQVRGYIDDATSTYAHFLESAPYFVTYYSRNFSESGEDVSLEAYNAITGIESPNHYTKIENFPIYGLDTADFGSDSTEIGWRANVETQCIILPNSITPNTHDMVLIELHSKKYLFTVTTSSSDNMNKSKFYRLTLKLDGQKVEDAEKAVTKVKGVDYELIGTKRNFVIEVSLLDKLNKLRERYDMILERYRHHYYSERAMVFFDKVCIDQYLNFFIWNNDLQIPFYDYRASTAINPNIRDYVDLFTYDKTIFGYLEDEQPMTSESRMFGNNGKLVHERSHYDYLYFLKTKFELVEYAEDGELFRTGLINRHFREAQSTSLDESPFIKLLVKVLRSFEGGLSKEEQIAILDEVLSYQPDFRTPSSKLYKESSYYEVALLLYTMKFIFNKLTID